MTLKYSPISGRGNTLSMSYEVEYLYGLNKMVEGNYLCIEQGFELDNFVRTSPTGICTHWNESTLCG